MERIEITLRSENDEVFAISLVKRPAIESDFVTLSSHSLEMKVINEEKRLIAGAVLIPEKDVYRKVGDKEFNMFFSATTIEGISQRWMERMKLQDVTIHHNEYVTGVYPVESWVVQDYSCDKAKLLNLDIPNGSWVVVMKVHDDEMWKQAKEGKIKGYSIEGKFDDYINYITQGQDEVSKLRKEIIEIIENATDI